MEGQKDEHEVELLKNKDLYIALNENKEATEDALDDIKKIMSKMQPGQMIASSDFKLQDTMSALEVNHIKMDPHYHNERVKTYKILVKEKKIKQIEDLSLSECLCLVDALFKRQLTYFYGASVQINIFSFVLFSDSSVNEESIIVNNRPVVLKCFINSILHIISLIYQHLSESSCLRDEDFGFLYLPNIKHLARDNILNDLKNTENFLNEQKEEGNKLIIEQILNRIRIQKLFIEMLTEQFDKENEKKYERLILYVNELKSEIDLINFEVGEKEGEKIKDTFNPDNYFDNELSKLVPNLINSKYSEIFNSAKAIEKINQFQSSLNFICQIYDTNNFFHLCKELIAFNSSEPSFIIREIVDINLFKEDLQFCKYNIRENILKITKLFKYKDIDDESLTYLVNSQKDICRTKLKNKGRQLREAKEYIDSLAVVACFIHRKETASSPGQKMTQTVLTNYAIRTLLTEILHLVYISFSLEIFKPYELDYVFFACEALATQLSFHVYVISKRFGEKILNEPNIAASKAKKKFTAVQKMLLDEIYVYEALKQAFNSLKCLMLYLKTKGIIKFPVLNEKQTELQIRNRFPYFHISNTFTNISYETFMNEKNAYEINEEYLDRATEALKSSVKSLEELKGADLKLRDYHSFDDEFLLNLIKSITANRLMFGRARKFVATEEKKYIDISINKNKYNTFLPIIELK